MQIIGIDPGETTGIVVAYPWKGHMVIVDALHCSGMRSAYWLTDALEGGNQPPAATTEVVIERFTISLRTLQGTRSGPMETLYAIGALRYVCDRAGVTPFFQTPAQAKSAYSDETIRDLGWGKRTNGPHERDALRHVLLHARTRRLWDGKSVDVEPETSS